MKAVLEALELHLDPLAAPALRDAVSAGAAAVRREWPDAADTLSGSDVMAGAIAAALDAAPSPRRLRLVGIPGTSRIDGAQSRISVFQAPEGLGATEILALSVGDAGPGLPDTHLVARTDRGAVPLALVCADLRLDTARDPRRLRPGAFAALGEIRISEGGAVSSVPCDGIVLADGELPADGFAREAAVALGLVPAEAMPAPRP